MNKIQIAIVGALLLGSAPATLLADIGPTAAEQRVQQLLAMSGKERRDSLKSLPPAERRGLWMAVKRAQAANRGQGTKVKGSGMQAHAQANPQHKSLPKVSQASRASRAIGTIHYDSGAFTTSFGGGAIVGNRFNTHTGIPVLASGTVSTVQAVVVPGAAATSSSAGFVILGPQTVGGGAGAIFSTFTGATGATDTLTFAGLGANYIGSEFYVLFGDFANSYIPVFGTGTTLAQGHHGVVGYTGGSGPNITGTFNFGGTLNSFIRTSGNLVPVELMSYGVD